MSTIPIVTIPADVLRAKTRPVTKFDAELQQLIDNMIAALQKANGAGPVSYTHLTLPTSDLV